MKAFLKENITLVIGVTLPIILTVVFLVVNQLGQAAIADPQHDLIFVNNQSSHANRTQEIIVKDQKVYLSFIAPEKENRYGNRRLELFIFSPGTNELKEITVPETRGLKQDKDILIDELADYKVSNKSESPDGYNFIRNRHNNSNLMTEIFGGGSRYRYNYVIEKGVKKIKVPKTSRYNSRLVGWTIEE